MVPGHLWTQLRIQQHRGPLARRGEWGQGEEVDKGWATILCCSGDTLPSGGGWALARTPAPRIPGS